MQETLAREQTYATMEWIVRALVLDDPDLDQRYADADYPGLDDAVQIAQALSIPVLEHGFPTLALAYAVSERPQPPAIHSFPRCRLGQRFTATILLPYGEIEEPQGCYVSTISACASFITFAVPGMSEDEVLPVDLYGLSAMIFGEESIEGRLFADWEDDPLRLMFWPSAGGMKGDFGFLMDSDTPNSLFAKVLLGWMRDILFDPDLGERLSGIHPQPREA